MKQLILKLFIVSLGCLNLGSANTIHVECADVTIHYKMGDCKKVEMSKCYALSANVRCTGADILDGAVEDLDLDEFAQLHMLIDGQNINPNSQITPVQLKSSIITVTYNPEENTPDKLKERRIGWLADQINQSVWYRAEAQSFVAKNFIDQTGKISSLKKLRALWSSRSV